MEQDKKNRLLKRISITLIAISIVLGLAVSMMGKRILDTRTLDQITIEIIESKNIKSNEINYIRKLDYNFYEVILDNGDVFTIRKNKNGEISIKEVGEKIRLEDSSIEEIID